MVCPPKRLNEVDTRTSTFCRPKPPNQSGFVISAVVQFNSRTQHFRTLRMLGRDLTVVLDGPLHNNSEVLLRDSSSYAATENDATLLLLTNALLIDHSLPHTMAPSLIILFQSTTPLACSEVLTCPPLLVPQFHSLYDIKWYL